MKALILVYSRATFEFTGKAVVRQRFPEQRDVARQGSIEPLARGIYLVDPNNDLEPHGVKPVEGVKGTDYDLVESAGKDIWPDPKGTIAEKFTELSAAQIDTIVGDLSRSA